MKTRLIVPLAAMLMIAPPSAQAAMPACPAPEPSLVKASLGLSTTTVEPAARALFDAGLVAYWAGDSVAALHAFRAAQAADPVCALCHWGEALALGPRVHVAMPHSQVRPAWEAIVHAQSLARNASELERDLIDATRHRYGVNPMVSRRQLDVAWATAIRQLAERHPRSDAFHLLVREADAILGAVADG
ncbi:hypothetical protein [Pararhodobacter sp. SW119]|uniref:hypothetical protein n=1 Tax=Pararhodobacter sp. SW119 TaxID=2780075 RepID=UPI001ADFA802|nr:hypothetical protein [Pararhodobacter sp. SW119]